MIRGTGLLVASRSSSAPSRGSTNPPPRRRGAVGIERLEDRRLLSGDEPVWGYLSRGPELSNGRYYFDIQFGAGAMQTDTMLNAVSITGPGGYNQPAIIEVIRSGPSIGYDAEYSAAPPTAPGVYAIELAQNQVKANDGAIVPGGPVGQIDIGGATGDPIAPVASLNYAQYEPIGNQFVVNVAYRDNVGFNFNPVSTNHTIHVIGPGGFDQEPALQDVLNIGGPAPALPTELLYHYQMPRPIAGGTYSVVIPDNAVKDTSGNFAAGGIVGTFQITGPKLGDANSDGVVDFKDLVALAQHYGQSNATWADGDFNGDGKVDFKDLVLLAQQYSAGPTAAAMILGNIRQRR